MLLSRLAKEDGFTLVELLVTILVVSVAVIPVVGSLDFSRQTTASGERHIAAAHAGEADLEKVIGQAYSTIGTTTAPAPSGSGNAEDPLNYVTAGPPPAYAYDWKQPSVTEPLVTGGTVAPSTTWGDSKLGGTIYRFVTYVSDPCPKCKQSQDYKRVSVVVTVTTSSKRTSPFIDSTIVRP